MLRLLRCSTAIGMLSSIITLAGRVEATEPIDDATKNAARDLAQRGKEAYDRGDYAAAHDLYGRAHALAPSPTLALREARALVKEGLRVQAAEACGQQDLEDFRTLRTTSTVGYMVGALGVAGGVRLYLLTPRGGTRKAGVAAYLTPTSAGILERF